ncbi:zinc finger BED domain-containing protein RICESLEEPER 1-like isoform X4 [Primulina tabacum]|uniref:zinc finger BED domain-containing protein RICESLEEPER 1-like isoform X4 n=1 Tax=Primulina tabacum TaxID=48773 RepID=UPI003F59CC00
MPRSWKRALPLPPPSPPPLLLRLTIILAASYWCSSNPNMSTPNTLSAQESSTTPVMGGVQLSTNDENEASQSKNAVELDILKMMILIHMVRRKGNTHLRLNATYFMLSTALKFKDVFPRYQQRDPTYNYLPSDEDWEKVIVVCSFLEEFNEVTHIISGSEYPTSKLFLPELYNIKKLLKNTNVGEDSFMADMIKKMKTKFDKYWGDCNLLISIAAVLDPRNKMKLIEWCFPEIYSEVDAVEHIVTVRETLRNLYNEYVEAHKKNIGEKDVQSESKRKL